MKYFILSLGLIPLAMTIAAAAQAPSTVDPGWVKAISDLGLSTFIAVGLSAWVVFRLDKQISRIADAQEKVLSELKQRPCIMEKKE